VALGHDRPSVVVLYDVCTTPVRGSSVQKGEPGTPSVWWGTDEQQTIRRVEEHFPAKFPDFFSGWER
jgi:hypothetical protein